MANVWWRVSQSVASAMIARKGVNIAGLGTFGIDESGFPVFVRLHMLADVHSHGSNADFP